MTSYELHYFEDLESGQTFRTRERTITEATIEQYAMLSGDWVEHHTSAPYADESMYGDRTAHGGLVFAIGTGLLYQTGALSRTMRAVTGTELTFPNPTYVGDTLSGEMTVLETTADAPFDAVGTVTLDGVVENQRDQTVCRIEADVLVDRRRQ